MTVRPKGKPEKCLKSACTYRSGNWRRLVAALGCAALVTAACTGSNGDSSGNDEGGEAKSAEEAAFSEFDNLRSDVRDWNRTAVVWVEAYLDPAVGASEFVVIAEPALSDLEATYERMRTRNLSGAPQAVEDAVDDVLVTYANKLGALTGIMTSVQIGDVDGEQRAMAMLENANEDGNRAACAMIQAVGGTPSVATDFGVTC